MSWPRAAQPTELAAWRRRREQDVAIRAFRRGRYSDTEFRAAAASAQLPADALEDEVLQRRELAAIVGWSLALKSKPSNAGLKWASEAADADRRGAQHPKRLGWLSLGALREQAAAFRQADGGWAADADSVPYLPPVPPSTAPFSAVAHGDGCRWRCASCGFHSGLRAAACVLCGTTGTGVAVAGFTAARAFGQRRCAFARPAVQRAPRAVGTGLTKISKRIGS